MVRRLRPVRGLVARVLAVVALAVAAGPAAASSSARTGERILAGPPEVVRDGGGWRIRFTVTRPVDVTVRVVDRDGRAVRHLASGMVGLERAARPLSPRRLSQSVLWDGKDDAGRPVAAAGCAARVLVGMRAAFDGHVLYRPDAIGPSRVRIFPGRGGEWLVSQYAPVHFDTLRVFSADGRYLRCLWPPGLDKRKDAVLKYLASPAPKRGVPAGAEDWDGHLVPACVNHNARYWFGTYSPQIIVTSDGQTIGVHGITSDYTALWRLDAEGFPGAWSWFPPWYAELRRTGFKRRWRLAAGRKGDFYLADATRHLIGHFRASDFAPIRSFTFAGHRKLPRAAATLGGASSPRAAATPTSAPAPQDAARFAGPDDIAVDKRGNLLVLDGGSVKVHAASGEFLERRDKSTFPSRGEPPKALRAAVGGKGSLAFPHVLRTTDRGRLIVRQGSRDPCFVATTTGGATAQPIRLPWGVATRQGYHCFDGEGNWYVSLHKGREFERDFIWKFAPDGSRLKFGGADEIVIEEGFEEIKGLFVAGSGDIYVTVAHSKWKKPPPEARFGDFTLKGDRFNLTRVDVYAADGRLKRAGLVRSQGLNDVAADREGNVYVLESTMWHGAQMSAIALGHTGRGRPWPVSLLPDDRAKLDPVRQHNKRFSLIGRLLKFPPGGGVMDGHDGLPGQLWSHPGISGLSPWNCGAECFGGQICLDADRRVWAPDTFMYCVQAVDGAGNLIARVGRYGNEDCRGGGGDRVIPGTKVVCDPEVPLARPAGVAVRRDRLFISDMYAHRIVRCRLDYARTATAPLPPPLGR